jgi:hypothetical protein
MDNFEIKLLSAKDGSWEQFRDNWITQCEAVGEVFEDYSPDVLSVIAGVVSGSLMLLKGTNESHVGALFDKETGNFYACCLLHRAMLPGSTGYTLRVRHLLVSPLLDYGVAPVQMYPDVVVGITLGIVHLSESVLSAEHIHFHLRSPEDMSYFRAFGMALDGANVFGSVQTRGAWLYISKASSTNVGLAEERK